MRNVLTGSLILVTSAGCGGSFSGGSSPVNDGGLSDASTVTPRPVGTADAAMPTAVDGGRPSSTDAGQPIDGVDGGKPVAIDAGTATDVCSNVLLCEKFDGYDAKPLQSNMALGPWKVQINNDQSAAVDTDKSYSGQKALKVHIAQGSKGGLFLETTAKPLFASKRSHLYGRFMLWHNSAKSSVHWTMFGLRGNVGPGNALSGHRVTYLFGANRENQFWSVYYDNVTAMDCSKAGTTTIPIGKWSCIQWEADSDNRKIDMWVDGKVISDLAVRDKGRYCVDQNRDANTPWYGPQSDAFYIGANSFHAMDGDLDTWIDDVMVDTQQVPCP